MNNNQHITSYANTQRSLNILRLLCFLLMLSVFSLKAYAGKCIHADDFGSGGTAYIYANPTEGNYTLLQDKPSTMQVAPWIDTGVYVRETSAANGESILKGYVSGEWFPWGDPGTESSECGNRECTPAQNDEQICLTEGKILTGDSDNLCKESDGMGLYGLIAIEDHDYYEDPNDLTSALTLPANAFRTFRTGPLKTSDTGAKYFEIKQTQSCSKPVGGAYTCTKDVNSDGQPTLKGGRLYFKIQDRFYLDNAGYYVVNIVSGVYVKNGFIATTIKYYTETLAKVTEVIYAYLTQTSGFVNIVRALLALYIVISSVLFAVGGLKTHYAELVMRLFKVAVIGILISESSWDFFNTYLFNLFTSGSQDIANIIVRSTIYGADEQLRQVFVMPEEDPAISVYDTMLQMLVSAPLHQKIWALLFTETCYMIIVIYICIILVIFGILNSILIYLLAIINMAFMLVIAPVFIPMSLFSLTKGLFDDWLKQLTSTALMIIFIAATLALMVTLIVHNIFGLLAYKVCWETIVLWINADIPIIDLKFWKIMDEAQAGQSLTFTNVIGFLMTALIFHTFMDHIPTIVDTLSGSALQPMSSIYGGALRQWHQSSIAKGIDKAQAKLEARIGAKYETFAEKHLQSDSKLKDIGLKIIRKPLDLTIGGGATSAYRGLWYTGMALERIGEADPGIFEGQQKESFINLDKYMKKPNYEKQYSVPEYKPEKVIEKENAKNKKK